MVVSVFLFSLRKKLQLYVFNPIFRAEDDGRVSHFEKKTYTVSERENKRFVILKNEKKPVKRGKKRDNN